MKNIFKKFLGLIPHPAAQVALGALDIITDKDVRKDNRYSISTRLKTPVAAAAGYLAYTEMFNDLVEPDKTAATAFVTLVSYLVCYFFRKKETHNEKL